jgi:hypothetical protein
MAHAMAIAMTQPENPLHPGMFSPETKALSAASSVVEGVRAAHLAAEGFTGALAILEHPAGFYRQFTMQRETPSPFLQLGEAWCTHALSFKRYAACAYAAGAVDAAREVRDDPAFDLAAVERIEVASSLPALIMERLAQPHEPGVLTPTNVQFSILRSVAYALWQGDIRGSSFLPDTFAAAIEPIRALSARATLVHDWKYTLHQLKGLDAGLRHGGGRRSGDMIQFYRTSGAFRRMFGSARAIGPADLVRLLRLPSADWQFFALRWLRSAGSHLRNAVGREEADVRPLGDLRRLAFCMGGRVTVVLRGGKTLVAERVIPTGMAGDPDRAKVVWEKLTVEATAVLGAERAASLREAITRIEAAPVITMPTMATYAEGTES